MDFQNSFKITMKLWRWSWIKNVLMKATMMILLLCRFTKKQLIFTVSYMPDTYLPQEGYKQWNKNIYKKPLEDVQEFSAMDNWCCLLEWQINSENPESRYSVLSVRMFIMLRKSAKILMVLILVHLFHTFFCRLF